MMPGTDTSMCLGQPQEAQLCTWCAAPLLARRRRGSVRQFCSAGHKSAFWTSLRRLAFAQFNAGEITCAMLKGGSRSVHALHADALEAGSSPTPKMAS